MPDDEQITWLHLSDHHAKQRGGAVRHATEQAFERSVREHVEHLGAPDLLLFTGDLVFKGATDEYKAVNKLLDRINAWVGGELPVFAVPGNHDLVRPSEAEALQYEFLTSYETSERLRKRFESRQRIAQLDKLFANYSAWAEERVFVPARAADRLSHVSTLVPGDFSAVFTKGELRLGLVGLNSSWVQYDGSDFFGKLQLPPEQFYAALPQVEDGVQPLDWFKTLDATLLLTHHPPSWLSPKAQEIYKRDIHTTERFALALYGHMHQAQSEVVSASGTHPRAYYQSPSLFGLEHYGADNEDRSFGYSWGRVWASGELRVWPKVAVEQGGSDVFIDAPAFPHVGDRFGGIQVRLPRHPSVSFRTSSPASSPSISGEGSRSLSRGKSSQPKREAARVGSTERYATMGTRLSQSRETSPLDNPGLKDSPSRPLKGPQGEERKSQVSNSGEGSLKSGSQPIQTKMRAGWAPGRIGIGVCVVCVGTGLFVGNKCRVGSVDRIEDVGVGIGERPSQASGERPSQASGERPSQTSGERPSQTSVIARYESTPILGEEFNEVPLFDVEGGVRGYAYAHDIRRGYPDVRVSNRGMMFPLYKDKDGDGFYFGVYVTPDESGKIRYMNSGNVPIVGYNAPYKDSQEFVLLRREQIVVGTKDDPRSVSNREAWDLVVGPASGRGLRIRATEIHRVDIAGNIGVFAVWEGPEGEMMVTDVEWERTRVDGGRVTVRNPKWHEIPLAWEASAKHECLRFGYVVVLDSPEPHDISKLWDVTSVDDELHVFKVGEMAWKGFRPSEIDSAITDEVFCASYSGEQMLGKWTYDNDYGERATVVFERY